MRQDPEPIQRYLSPKIPGWLPDHPVVGVMRTQAGRRGHEQYGEKSDRYGPHDSISTSRVCSDLAPHGVYGATRTFRYPLVQQHWSMKEPWRAWTNTM